jgi:hypothetical protein
MSAAVYLIPLVLAAYYLCVWWLVHATPRQVIVVRYQPPAALSPAAMRYLFALAWDGRTYAAILAQLAACKLISISLDHAGHRVYLNKLGNDRLTLKQLPAEAQIVFKDVFEWEDTVELKTPEPGLIHKIQQSLQTQLNKYITWHIWFIGIAILTSAAATIWVCLSSHLFGDDLVEAGIMSCFTGLTVAIISAAAAYVWNTNLQAIKLAFKGLYHRRPLVLLLFLILLYPTLWYLLMRTVTPTFANMTGLLILVNMLAAPLLRSYTPAGRQLLNEILGFRQFLERAEQDRLQRLNPPDRALQADEEYLPYAIALDVREDWGDRLGIKAMVETAL